MQVLRCMLIRRMLIPASKTSKPWPAFVVPNSFRAKRWLQPQGKPDHTDRFQKPLKGSYSGDDIENGRGPEL